MPKLGGAQHPYQHRGSPYTKGEKDPRPDKGNFGIGRTEEIFSKIKTLYRARRRDNRRLLIGPKSKVPVLHFTEFGYKNLPDARRKKAEFQKPPDEPSSLRVRKANNYWHTEVRRANLCETPSRELESHICG